MWILGNPMKIEGKEFSNERAIYISNHASPIDIFLIMWLTPTGTVCIAKKEVHSLSDLSLPSFLLTAHYWFKLYQNFDMYINSYNSWNLPTLRLVVLRPGDRRTWREVFHRDIYCTCHQVHIALEDKS